MSENNRVQGQLEPHDLVDEQGNLVLSVSEWYSIQAYEQYGLALPTSEAELFKALGMDAGETFGLYKDLQNSILGTNKKIRNNSCFWQDEVYLSIVTLADDIVSYARLSMGAYRRLLTLSDDAGDSLDPTSDEGGRFLTLLGRLSKEAGERADRAAAVYKDITTYRESLQANKKELNLTRGEASDDYDELQIKTKAAWKLADAAREASKAAHDEYAHSVVVAATTPTYGWFWPFGTIAATVVAGVYTEKALKAKDNIAKYTAEFDTYTAEARRQATFSNIVVGARSHVDESLLCLGPAEAAVQKVEGAWRLVSDDLKSVVDALQSTEPEEDVDWRAVEIDSAIQAWDAVRVKADFWRVYAFIKIEQDAA